MSKPDTESLIFVNDFGDVLHYAWYKKKCIGNERKKLSLNGQYNVLQAFDEFHENIRSIK